MKFDHVGMISEEPRPGERFVEATRVWRTDSRRHPFRVEWLRFEPDSLGSIHAHPEEQRDVLRAGSGVCIQDGAETRLAGVISGARQAMCSTGLWPVGRGPRCSISSRRCARNIARRGWDSPPERLE